MEEFSLDSMENGKLRRKSKKEVLIAKDVDIEKVTTIHGCLQLTLLNW